MSVYPELSCRAASHVFLASDSESQHPALSGFYFSSLPLERPTQRGDLISARTDIKQVCFSERPPGLPQWKSITGSQPQSVTVCCCCCCYQEHVQGEDGNESGLRRSGSIFGSGRLMIYCILHKHISSLIKSRQKMLLQDHRLVDLI